MSLIYVVSDREGPVGAYSSLRDAERDVLGPYRALPLRVQCFGGPPTSAVHTAWVVAYAARGAPTAYAGYDRAAARRAAAAIVAAGLSDGEPADALVLEVGVGRAPAAVRARLDAGLDASRDAPTDPEAAAARACRELARARAYERVCEHFAAAVARAEADGWAGAVAGAIEPAGAPESSCD